ncbi:MAG: hypothetical protein KKA05_07090, partial [Alphaproteobacteria bacterium]|nr:hypothetical protein [Alphaproteobacteria bacterium]
MSSRQKQMGQTFTFPDACESVLLFMDSYRSQEAHFDMDDAFDFLVDFLAKNPGSFALKSVVDKKPPEINPFQHLG